MEYIYEQNRICAVECGEELGEVTFAQRRRDAQTPQGATTYIINHTYVDDRLRGHGIAAELVRRAVEHIESAGGRVEATCSYAQLWLARNRGQ